MFVCLSPRWHITNLRNNCATIVAGNQEALDSALARDPSLFRAPRECENLIVLAQFLHQIFPFGISKLRREILIIILALAEFWFKFRGKFRELIITKIANAEHERLLIHALATWASISQSALSIVDYQNATQFRRICAKITVRRERSRPNNQLRPVPIVTEANIMLQTRSRGQCFYHDNDAV